MEISSCFERSGGCICISFFVVESMREQHKGLFVDRFLIMTSYLDINERPFLISISTVQEALDLLREPF